MKGPTLATCELVDERDRWACARCGISLHITPGSRHHRQLRRHGDHSPANLVLLCGSGTTGCHGWVHAHPRIAYRQGWLVHSWHDPAEVPLRSATLRCELTNDREGHSHTMNDNEAALRRAELGLTA